MCAHCCGTGDDATLGQGTLGMEGGGALGHDVAHASTLDLAAAPDEVEQVRSVSTDTCGLGKPVYRYHKSVGATVKCWLLLTAHDGPKPMWTSASSGDAQEMTSIGSSFDHDASLK